MTTVKKGDRTALNLTERNERNLRILEIVNTFPHVVSCSIKRKPGGSKTLCANIILDTGEEIYIQEPQLLKGKIPKPIAKLITQDKAEKVASEFLNNIEFIYKKNGSSMSHFIVGNLKCNGDKYQAVVGRIIKGMVPMEHKVWAENIKYKQILESEGFIVRNIEINKSNPRLYLTYNGFDCETSMQSIRQGSRPAIASNSAVYIECQKRLISEGFTGLDINIQKSKYSNEPTAHICLVKHGIEEWYPISSIMRNNRPFIFGRQLAILEAKKEGFIDPVFKINTKTRSAYIYLKKPTISNGIWYSMSSFKSGSRPLNFIYEETIIMAQNEGYINPTIRRIEGEVSLIYLKKGASEVWYKLKAFREGRRPFSKIGLYCYTFFKNNPEMKDKSAILYHIRFDCKINNDSFHKYGITTSSVKNRFSRESNYIITIISIHKTTLFDAFQKEQKLLESVSSMAYYPVLKLKSGGNTECFKPNENFQDHIFKEFNNTLETVSEIIQSNNSSDVEDEEFIEHNMFNDSGCFEDIIIDSSCIFKDDQYEHDNELIEFNDTLDDTNLF